MCFFNLLAYDVFSLPMKKESLGQFSDDELLIRHKQSPDPDILAELFNRYYHLVYGVCLKYLKNKEEASDAAMQIFSKLLEDLHKYEIQFFRAWL